MTLTDMSKLTNKSIRTIQRYAKKYFPELDVKNPSKCNLKWEQKVKLLEVCESVSLKELSEKTGYSRFLIEKHTMLMCPEAIKYHKKTYLNKKQQEIVIKSLEYDIIKEKQYTIDDELKENRDNIYKRILGAK